MLVRVPDGSVLMCPNDHRAAQAKFETSGDRVVMLLCAARGERWNPSIPPGKFGGGAKVGKPRSILASWRERNAIRNTQMAAGKSEAHRLTATSMRAQ
jgi:hypothetical protein